MAGAKLIVAALGALALAPAPGAISSALASGAASAQRIERTKAPSARHPLPVAGQPRFGHPEPESFKPVFLSRTNRAQYAAIRAAPNPLMTAEFRATPEYEYLYTPAVAHRAKPPVARYSYARDFSYLMRPTFALTAAAAAYAWRDTPLQLLWTTVGAHNNAPQPGMVVISREAGQARSSLSAPGGRTLLRPGVVLDERFAPERPRGGR